jgi:hypothetical protein
MKTRNYEVELELKDLPFDKFIKKITTIKNRLESLGGSNFEVGINVCGALYISYDERVVK